MLGWLAGWLMKLADRVDSIIYARKGIKQWQLK